MREKTSYGKNKAFKGGNEVKVVIAGGTGFVGKALVKELVDNGHTAVILTRKSQNFPDNPQIHYVEWLNGKMDKNIEGAEVIINLAGESINSGRWTEERKSRILSSRIDSTNEIISIITKMEVKPKTLVNASAIGYYGTSASGEFNEDSPLAGTDFLATTVAKWEETALDAEKLGIRTVFCRFGIILSKHGGALPRMTFPYRLFAGGTVGSGNQWTSWIHLEDVVKALLFVMKQKQLEGPINFTAPNPVTMKEFGRTLGRRIHRPHWLPVPAFALKMILGEMSSLVLEGQKVLPKRLLDNNFSFNYPTLENALKNIYNTKY